MPSTLTDSVGMSPRQKSLLVWQALQDEDEAQEGEGVGRDRTGEQGTRTLVTASAAFLKATSGEFRRDNQGSEDPFIARSIIASDSKILS